MFKQIFTIIIIAIIFFGLGFYLSSIYKPVAGDNTFEAGWEAAKQRLSETGFMSLIEGMEIKSVDGEVKQIQDNKISLKIRPLEPLADPDLDNRIVEVDQNTKIYKLVEKDQAQYQKEMEEFNRRMEEQMKNPEAVTELVVPPEPYNKEEISLADIKVGQRIAVSAQENIKDKKQFKAVEITVQPLPAGLAQ